MRIVWQNYKDNPIDTTRDSDSIKFKLKLTNNTNNEGTANVERAAPLKYFGGILKCH